MIAQTQHFFMLKLHLFALYADVKELVEGLALNGFVSLFGLNGDKIQNAYVIISLIWWA